MAEGSPDGGAGGRASVTATVPRPCHGTPVTRGWHRVWCPPEGDAQTQSPPPPRLRPLSSPRHPSRTRRLGYTRADEATSLCRGPCGLQPRPVLNPAKPRMPNAPRKE